MLNRFLYRAKACSNLLMLGVAALALYACEAPSRTSAENVRKTFTPPKAGALPEIVAGNGMYLPDFSYAGYKNGAQPLPEITGKVFDVTAYGAIPDDTLDDSKAVQRAVDAANAHDGPVIVRFPAGRFYLSDILYIERGNFALQGAGDQTVLYYPRPLKFLPTPTAFNELSEYLVEFDKRQREPENNIDLPFSLYAWSGGFIWTQTPGARGKEYLEKYDNFPAPLTDAIGGERGRRTVKVANPDALKVGEVLKLQWFNTNGEAGTLIDAMYGPREKVAHIGSHHWMFPRRALVSQTTKILAIDGDTVTIADPLLMDIRAEWEPKFVPWPHLSNVFISDFRVEFPNGPFVAHHVEDGYNGLYLTGLYDSAVRNIRFTNADSGILMEDSANLTIDSIVTDGLHRAHYTVAAGSVYNTLIQNLRVENVAEHPMSMNTYSVKTVYKDSVGLAVPRLDQHSGANHQNLFDNIKVRIDLADDETRFKLFDGGGAGYWKPSHGQYSTFYNIEVEIVGGGEGPITLTGPQDGPGARILGVHGNREFTLEYGPEPHVEQLNTAPAAPSLYELQLNKRLGK